MAEFSAHPEPSRRTWMVSLGFWLCLLCAAGLYAVAALAPGWSAVLMLRDDYDRNQRQLVALERRTGYLGQVVRALETDPDFAAELARVDFDAARPGEEQIPVGPELMLHASPSQAVPGVKTERRSWPRWMLNLGAHNGTVRSVILGLSVLLVLFAFTLVPNPYRQPDDSTTSIGWRTRLIQRYTLRSESAKGPESCLGGEE